MNSLNVEIDPDKKWLNRTKNGFDFLGYRVALKNIQATTTNVSCRDEKFLYKQSVNTRRIGQYLRQWLGFGLFAVSIGAVADPGQPAAEPSHEICKVTRQFTANNSLTKYIALIPGTFSNGRGASATSTKSITINSNASEIAGGISTTFAKGGYYFNISSTTAPAAGFTLPELNATIPPINIPLNTTTRIYISFGADASDNVCSYSYDIVNTNGSNKPSNLQAYIRK